MTDSAWTNDFLILQQGQQAIDNHVADATLQLEQGQRVTDARVSQAHGDLANGQRSIVEDINNASHNVIREVSTDTQFLNAGQQRITDSVDRGFIGSARDAAATDRNVDAVGRHLDTGQRFIDQEVNRGFLGVERGQASTDRNVDHNASYIKHDIYGLDKDMNHGFRWLGHEDREHERYESGEFRGLERGQRHTDDRVNDGFFRTAREIDHGFAHSNEENAEAFGDTQRRLSDVTRNAADAVQARLADSELRMTKNMDDAERRTDNLIYRNVSHSLEEVSEALADHDRRSAERLQGISGEVRLEAERTRSDAVKNELETRLYLRDREDRTHDLIRTLADRNLDEMRGFERRSRDDEGHTRDLIRHIDEESSERAYLKSALAAQELRTELAIDRALKCHRGRGHDDDGNFRYEPRINITLDDTVVDDIRNRNSSRNRNNTGVEIGV